MYIYLSDFRLVYFRLVYFRLFSPHLPAPRSRPFTSTLSLSLLVHIFFLSTRVEALRASPLHTNPYESKPIIHPHPLLTRIFLCPPCLSPSSTSSRSSLSSSVAGSGNSRPSKLTMDHVSIISSTSMRTDRRTCSETITSVVQSCLSALSSLKSKSDLLLPNRLHHGPAQQIASCSTLGKGTPMTSH